MSPSDLALALAFAAAALLYASVGHAGASAYLAIMALAGLAPETMRPTALVLNLVVGTIALVQFARAGLFSWSLLWPFAVGSVPLAVLGGSLAPSGAVYRSLVALALLAAAARLALGWAGRQPDGIRPPPRSTAAAVGAAVGLVAGLSGTGGGIFLSPILVLRRWAEPRQTGGVAAAFILMNSVAGLAGSRPALAALPPALPLWALAVAAGGVVGSYVGSRRADPVLFRRLLAGVLVVAAARLLVG